MKLYENLYTELLSNYYPRDVNCFHLDYVNSIQSENLKKTIDHFHNLKDLEIKSFLKFKGYVELKMGRNFPCFIFQKEIYNNTKEKKVNNLNISFLGPFFHYSTLLGDKDTGLISEFNKTEFELSLSLLNEFELFQFPKNLLSKKIHDKFLRENFTFFNAYFVDAHRIYNF